MIHKLRRKFILINMSLVTAVLLVVFGALCLSTYRSEKQANLSVLEQTLALRRDLPDSTLSVFLPDTPFPDIGKPEDRNPADPSRLMDFTPQERLDQLKPCILVILDTNENLLTIADEENAFLEQEDISEAIDVIREDHSDLSDCTGLLSSMGLRYSTRAIGSHTLLALVDRSNETVALRNLLLASLIIGTASLAAFFVISLFLSSWALRPVEKAWKQQQQFIADVSHELKTPLTIILANLGILQAHPEDTIADQNQWISNTRMEAQRMKKLVDDLLYLAKSDAGRQNTVLSDVNLSDIVWSAMLPFESLAFEKKTALDGQIAPDLHIQGDSGSLKQLVAILLDNACKYSVPDSTITVSLTQEQNHCYLRVSNQGVVIDAIDREHLFERFYRSDESRARKAGGYGLGLSIAKSIVDTHGGRIFIERSDETVTTFCVIF